MHRRADSMGKKLPAVLLAACMCVCAAGCGSNNDGEETYDANAPYTASTVGEGLYIMSADGYFYYANTDGQNFSNETTGANAGRIICSKDDSKYIPTLYTDDYVVYFTKGTIPASFGIERFCDAGWTVGLYGLAGNGVGNYTFSGSNIISGSEISNNLNGYISSSDTATILTVDGNEPGASDLTLAGTLSGYEQGQQVNIAFMKGTYYSEFTTTADMHIWYSAETTEVTGYRTTTSGFIVLELPDGLEGSYISIAGTGLMYVSDTARPAGAE